jgi:hypothetical protein
MRHRWSAKRYKNGWATQLFSQPGGPDHERWRLQWLTTA